MNRKVIFCAVVVGVFALAAASPAVADNPSQNLVHVEDNTSVEETLLKKLNSKCTNGEINSCMMLKLVTYFNRLMKKSNIELGDVEITQTSTETVNYVNQGRSLQDVAKMSDEEQLSTVIADKAVNFLQTRSLKWKVMDEAEVIINGKGEKDGGVTFGFSLRPTPASNNGESRKKKDKEGMNGMMAAIAMKLALIKALAFKALVMLVGKALLVSKLALVLAAVIGLKKLFSSEKHVTYEVVASHGGGHHDSHSDHHSSGGHDSYGGGGGGWGRNYEAANLAYRGHIPTSQ